MQTAFVLTLFFLGFEVGAASPFEDSKIFLVAKHDQGGFHNLFYYKPDSYYHLLGTNIPLDMIIVSETDMYASFKTYCKLQETDLKTYSYGLANSEYQDVVTFDTQLNSNYSLWLLFVPGKDAPIAGDRELKLTFTNGESERKDVTCYVVKLYSKMSNKIEEQTFLAVLQDNLEEFQFSPPATNVALTAKAMLEADFSEADNLTNQEGNDTLNNVLCVVYASTWCAFEWQLHEQEE